MNAVPTQGPGQPILCWGRARCRVLPGLLSALLFGILAPPTLAAQDSTVRPEESVADLARAFLSALSSGDTTTLSVLLAPEAMIYSVREDPAGPSIRPVSRASFLEGMGREGRVLLERMWDPTVLVQSRVAMVWTPYDFHLNGELSHCGIDVFTMLEGAEGWKVASITYNVVREGCPPSPLGPPGGGRR